MKPAAAQETLHSDAVRTRMDEAARLTEASSANTEEVSATTEQTASASPRDGRLRCPPG